MAAVTIHSDSGAQENVCQCFHCFRIFLPWSDGTGHFSSVQFSCSVVSYSLRPHESQHARPPCASPTPRIYPNYYTLSRWCHPTILSSVAPSPPALSLSQHQGFYSESALCIRWPKYWSYSFNISPSDEYSGLISFRIDWFDILAVQGTQEFSLTLQFKSTNSLALSLLYGPSLTSITTTGKTIAMWTFVGKVMSLLFNTLSRFAIAFHPRSKCLLFSWIQSPSAVILE